MNRRFHLAVLHIAARLAPAPQRSEWLAEWQTELCYVPPGRRTGFCLGAFPDAYWLRRNDPAPVVFLQCPWQCLSALAIVAALSLFFAHRLPAVQAFFPPPYADAHNLVTISGISAADYRTLAREGDSSQLAFYYPLHTRLGGKRLTIMIAGRNLFALLGIPIGAAPSGPSAGALILTDAAWRENFHRDPRIVGRELRLAEQPAQVTAIVSDRVWHLPGRADAWLLIDEQSIANIPEDARGIVLAHGAASLKDRFHCVAVSNSQPLLGLLIMTLIGAIVVPSVTSITLGEYPWRQLAFPPAVKIRRWLFLAAKIVLILPIVSFGSLDLLSLIAVNLQAHALLVSSVLGFRWVLTDQRRRCPVCLRVLSHPTSIGQASRTFLEWYGTELMCTRGHGLLHVPEIPNGYSTPRWLHLDSSWSSLFCK